MKSRAAYAANKMRMKDSFAENYWDSIKGHESSQENLCEFEEKNKDCPGLIT